MSRRIVVLCNYPFPEGLAATNRIYAYCKGLNQNGLCAEVLTFSPHGILKGDPPNLTGQRNGVMVHHPHYYFINGSKIRRVFYDLRLFKIKALLWLIREKRREKLDLVFISFDQAFFLLFYLPILFLFNIKMAFISDEYPPAMRNQSKPRISFIQTIFYKCIHRVFGFRILMTEGLAQYYNHNISVKPSFVLGTITDSDRYEGLSKELPYSYKICYVGNLELQKDNVDNLIVAFNLIKDKYTHLSLHLYGAPSPKDLNTLEVLIKQNNLSERVFIEGRLGFESVPRVLTEAFILVTSRPRNIRAAGGFPTKLGEYLMSGTPAILTNVGEIGNYIKDGENAFLVDAEDPKSFADKLEYVINNYDEALKVAERGKDYIQKNFSCKAATTGLAEFILQRMN